MRELYGRWAPRGVQLATILVRQGHPGPEVRAYRSSAEKRLDAEAHQFEDDIPWPVLTDDVDGYVHRNYGGLADPTFVIDRDGRIAFYQAITHAPTLHRALVRLFANGGRGVIGRGYDRVPHLLPVIAGGWPAIARGLPQSAIDLETAVPGTALFPWLGSRVRPLLAPIALRGTPLPLGARLGLAAALIGVAALASRTRRSHGTRRLR